MRSSNGRRLAGISLAGLAFGALLSMGSSTGAVSAEAQPCGLLTAADERQQIELALDGPAPDLALEGIVVALDEHPLVLAAGLVGGSVEVQTDRDAGDVAIGQLLDGTGVETADLLGAGIVSVASSCVSLADLHRADAAIRTIALEETEFVSFGYSLYVDRIVVSTNIDEARIAEVLDTSSGLYVLQHTSSQTGGFLSVRRNRDFKPHYGGALIETPGTFPIKQCTSGFSLESNKASTAAHCFLNITTSEDWYSGNKLFAKSGYLPDWPAYDIARLNGGGPDAPISYNDGGIYGHAFVESAGNPGNGFEYCNLGFFSRVNCFTQTHSNQTYCHFYGCTIQLSSSNTLGPEGIPGDSGGPIARSDLYPVKARGLVSAELGPFTGGYYVFYYRRTSDIEAKTAYDIATSSS